MWKKHYGGSAADYAYDICENGTGGYVISGYTASVTNDLAGKTVSGNDGVLFNISADGTLLNVVTLSGSGDDRISAVKKTADGGYIANKRA